jgi:hypothetical protein
MLIEATVKHMRRQSGMFSALWSFKLPGTGSNSIVGMQDDLNACRLTEADHSSLTSHLLLLGVWTVIVKHSFK